MTIRSKIRSCRRLKSIWRRLGPGPEPGPRVGRDLNIQYVKYDAMFSRVFLAGWVPVLLAFFSAGSMASGCDAYQTEGIERMREQSQRSAARLLENVRSALESEKDEATVSALRHAKKTLSCVYRKLSLTRFACVSSDHPICDDPMTAAAAGGWIFLDSLRYSIGGRVSNKVRLCPFFWQSTASFHAGAFLHEVSHVCGTRDATYFGDHGRWMGAPRNVDRSSWADIADTYSYWARYGFCVPGRNCR